MSAFTQPVAEARSGNRSRRGDPTPRTGLAQNVFPGNAKHIPTTHA